jgi:hypothetical protein
MAYEHGARPHFSRMRNIVIFCRFGFTSLFALVASTLSDVPQPRGDNLSSTRVLSKSRKQVVAPPAYWSQCRAPTYRLGTNVLRDASRTHSIARALRKIHPLVPNPYY